MKIKFLHLLIPKVLCIIAFIAGSGGVASAQVSSSSEIRQEVISLRNFNQLTPEKQAYVKSHPELFRVSEETVQPQMSCSKVKAPVLVRAQVSAQELSKMEPAKQALIKGSPDMYEIVDGPVTIQKQKFHATELLDMEEAVRNRIISRTDAFEVEKVRMRSENVRKMDVSARMFIENNPNLFSVE